MTKDAPTYNISFDECEAATRSLSFYGGDGPMITFYPDGRVQLAANVSEDAAAQQVCALIIKHFGAMLNERIAELERENAALQAKLAEGARQP